jgi:hypothetical protein
MLVSYHILYLRVEQISSEAHKLFLSQHHDGAIDYIITKSNLQQYTHLTFACMSSFPSLSPTLALERARFLRGWSPRACYNKPCPPVVGFPHRDQTNQPANSSSLFSCLLHPSYPSTPFVSPHDTHSSAVPRHPCSIVSWRRRRQLRWRRFPWYRERRGGARRRSS